MLCEGGDSSQSPAKTHAPISLTDQGKGHRGDLRVLWKHAHAEHGAIPGRQQRPGPASSPEEAPSAEASPDQEGELLRTVPGAWVHVLRESVRTGCFA